MGLQGVDAEWECRVGTQSGDAGCGCRAVEVDEPLRPLCCNLLTRILFSWTYRCFAVTDRCFWIHLTPLVPHDIADTETYHLKSVATPL